MLQGNVFGSLKFFLNGLGYLLPLLSMVSVSSSCGWWWWCGVKKKSYIRLESSLISEYMRSNSIKVVFLPPRLPCKWGWVMALIEMRDNEERVYCALELCSTGTVVLYESSFLPSCVGRKWVEGKYEDDVEQGVIVILLPLLILILQSRGWRSWGLFCR